jgi:hypothetical protein
MMPEAKIEDPEVIDSNKVDVVMEPVQEQEQEIASEHKSESE